MEWDGISAGGKFLERLEREAPGICLDETGFRAPSASKQHKPVVGESQRIDGRASVALLVVKGMETVFAGLFHAPYTEEPDGSVLKADHDVIFLSVDCYALAPQGRRYAILNYGSCLLHQVHDSQL